jgi:acetyltransferase-like isoleucine patch superfamily enzyme
LSVEIISFADDRPVPENVVFGHGCRLEKHRLTFERFRSRQQPGLRVGDRVELHLWSSFSVEPEGVVEVGDDSILVGAAIMCAERVTIGRRVVISYNVTIADCDFHPLDPELRKLDAIANAPESTTRRPALVSSPVTIEDGAWLGIGAVVLKGVTIGAGARIAPGAVVTKSVPAGAEAVGNPADVSRGA